jgi:hypothetical protein
MEQLIQGIREAPHQGYYETWLLCFPLYHKVYQSRQVLPPDVRLVVPRSSLRHAQDQQSFDGITNLRHLSVCFVGVALRTSFGEEIFHDFPQTTRGISAGFLTRLKKDATRFHV